MPVLYHLTLKRPTGITQAVQGSFSAPKAQEIVVARSHILELLSPDSNGKLQSICVCDVFGIVRTMSTFCLTGTQRDYLVVGSDSGRLVVLEFCAVSRSFKRIHCETFGKTGIRRIVPGQYLAVDPKGRAVIIGAVERQKFVYILNRDAKANLTISSPLEAHKSHSICFDLVGLDVGFENPVFASIEQSYEAVDALQIDLDEELTDDALRKGVSFWELDLGLNHVVKKVTLPIDLSAHLLIPVPGGDGPGGVVVCCENFLVYKNVEHAEVACAYPRRLEMPQEKSLIIVAYAVHRMKDFFFILIQSEFGDVYKVELTYEEGVVKEIVCRYFDTVPVSVSLCILRSGYLFVASEFGNHHLYQFTGLGTDERDPLCTSLHPHGRSAIIAFKPRALQNLQLVDELSSLSAITDMKVADIQGLGQHQIFLGCGRGSRSSLRVLRYGIAIEGLASSELPGRPKSVWTVRSSFESAYDGFIIVGFEGNTLVLSVGEAVEEVTDSCFLTSITTLHVALMGDGSFIQVHDAGIRHVYDQRVKEWRAPSSKRVKVAASNDRQVILGLSGGDVIYFEIDDSGNLVEYAKKSLSVEISCLDLQPTPKGRILANFMAIGTLDNSVRVLTLDKSLKVVSTQILSNNSTPESVCISEFAVGDSSLVYLHVGLNTGVMLRSTVDPISGALSDQESRFLGGRAVKFRRVSLGSSFAIVALSDKPWLIYTHRGILLVSPINVGTLESADSLISPICPDGFVAVSGNTLRIFRCTSLGETFAESQLPLTYTPRKLVLMPSEAPSVGSLNYMLAIVESDHARYNEDQSLEIKNVHAGIELPSDYCESLDYTDFKAEPGKWGSCLRIVNPLTLETVAKLLFETDEAAMCAQVVVLDGIQCLVVGTAIGMNLKGDPDSVSGYLRVYAYGANYEIRLLHATPITGVPRALAGYEGKLICALGSRLRLYALGKRQLLLKAEHRTCTDHGFIWISVCGSRIFAGDIREGFQLLRLRFYAEDAAEFEWIGHSTGPRWLSCCEQLDYHTVIGGDKFDSLFIARVPQEEFTKATQFENHAQFHLGDLPTAISKVSFNNMSQPIVIYSTILGSIGAFIPYANKDELDLMQHLEMIMANEHPPLCGREHAFFRSYYYPVQNIVDGDLCEQVKTLPEAVQRKIATQLDTNVHTLLRKVDDVRNRIL
ncbi:CPSF A subunit region domain-containing protein [Theileria equi strain WA]|uniref:CPSF A subunit region domain-containing protein n=1 Tax=Theileria equi strain WA TaxID=1537102 RepID=L0B0L5_THEEQ|nr:CPSF A subunit region domain-containing protein [Theileria equi strain WA]AFZ81043.1 CPSF A subunit region domain-containing protein [Theileria equi strain WA]|eukprot:XP_004830709.1 CPSF A subunit region domain-containing protein [Theileria equi strain WA]